ncbi:UNVERIFIED_CONTAM: hypothetical protein FKN15_056916 [Acipenser sinensis]
MVHFSTHVSLHCIFLILYYQTCQALRTCGDITCEENQGCCVFGNTTSPQIRCCKQPLNTFIDSVAWITRKLSGILILLLLFAMGYFVQRIICPRPQRHQDSPEDPSLLNGHTTASQDFLIDRFPELDAGYFISPVLQLPAYEEVKYLPTYEETMQVDRDRSDDDLLVSAELNVPVPVERREESSNTDNAVRTSWSTV